MAKHIQPQSQECNDMVDKKVFYMQKKLINSYSDRTQSQHIAATAVANRTQPYWRWSWEIMKNWNANKMSPSSNSLMKNVLSSPRKNVNIHTMVWNY
jgi:hypothetical protein